MVVSTKFMKNIAGLFLVGLVLGLLASNAVGESAGSGNIDCSGMILAMNDCLSFVTSGSTLQKPEGTCCSGLRTVLKTDAKCLCEAFTSSAQLGVSPNITRAFALPSACHLSVPSMRNCGLSSAPGAAPALPPTAVSSGSESAAAPPTIAGGAPAAAPGSSGSSKLAVSLASMLALVAISLSLF